jgi:hypothetical protein
VTGHSRSEHDKVPLTISQPSQATTAGIEAVILRTIRFENTSDNPSATPRRIRITLTDGDSGTALAREVVVNVIPVDDPPTNSGGAGPRIFTGVPLLPFPTATLMDFDATLFAGSMLTVQPANGAGGDTLGIRNQGTFPGQINVVNGNQIRSGLTVIGTFAGGLDGTPLVITLYANATTASVQALMRSIVFTTTVPGTLSRTLDLTFQEADGTSSNTLSQIINRAVVPA